MASNKPKVQVWREISDDEIIQDPQDKDWVEVQIPGGQRIRIKWPQGNSSGNQNDDDGNQTGQSFGSLDFTDNEDPSPPGAVVYKSVKEQGETNFKPYEGENRHTNVVEARVIKTYPGGNPMPKAWSSPASQQPIVSASGEFHIPNTLQSESSNP